MLRWSALLLIPTYIPRLALPAALLKPLMSGRNLSIQLFLPTLFSNLLPWRPTVLWMHRLRTSSARLAVGWALSQEILARPRFCFSDFQLLSSASTLSSFWILSAPPTKTRTFSHQWYLFLASRSNDHRSKSLGTQKLCRRVFLHFCECWLLQLKYGLFVVTGVLRKSATLDITNGTWPGRFTWTSNWHLSQSCVIRRISSDYALNLHVDHVHSLGW